jgi:DNA-binding response OmpR family regulator
VIDDNEELARLLRIRLKPFADVTILSDGWEVVTYLTNPRTPAEAIILDLMLPGRTGMELLSTLRCMEPKAKIFIYTGHEESSKGVAEYADGCFMKTDEERLINSILMVAIK